MKKPVPSRKEAVLGLIITAVMVMFGLFWTAGAFKESGIFSLFGIFWIGLVLIGAAPMFKAVFGRGNGEKTDKTENSADFTETVRADFSEDKKDKFHCPYCGERLIGENKFCPNCGKRL